MRSLPASAPLIAHDTTQREKEKSLKKTLCALALLSLAACTSGSAPPAECKEFFDAYDKATKEGQNTSVGFEMSALLTVARQFGPGADQRLTLWEGFNKMYGVSYEEAKAKGDKTVEVMKEQMASLCRKGMASLQVK